MSKTTTITGLTNDTEYFVRVFPRNNDEYYQTEPTAVGSATPIYFSLPTSTGSYAVFGDEVKGYAEFYESGTVTLTDFEYDIFLVGGGGYCQEHTTTYTTWSGAGSGYTKNSFGVVLVGELTVVIGINGGSTTFNNVTANGGEKSNNRSKGANGGCGGGAPAHDNSAANSTSAGTGGTDGGDGGNASSDFGSYQGGDGQGTTTKPFLGDVAPFNTRPLAGGGGGGSGDTGVNSGNGGSIGGGKGGINAKGTAGTPNTGGGAGGSAKKGGSTQVNGGSGIVIIRWGDWSVGSEDLEEVVA